MKFAVEQVLIIDGRAHVLARQLEPCQWKLSDSAQLGGAPIENWLDIPRTRDSLGKMRADLFAFVLRSATNASNFGSGEIVELTP